MTINNLCPRCGYPLADDYVCTNCGFYPSLEDKEDGEEKDKKDEKKKRVN